MTSDYIVVIQVMKGAVPIDEIKRVLDAAKDWGRMSPNVWFISTTMNADYWYRAVRAVLDQADNIVVHKLDPSDKAGWVNQPIIEYFSRSHSDRAGL